MTITVPAPMSRYVLLIKSASIAHKAGFALYGNPPRWHKVHAAKPAPVGAPVVRAVPQSGEAQMTPEMWGKLYAHPDNSNKAVYTKKLEKLQSAFEAGDVNAILAGSYPNDTTNKKVVKIANYLLGIMGSDHQVHPGLKTGTHAALSAQPEPGPAAPADHEQVNQAAQQAADQAVTSAAPPKVDAHAHHLSAIASTDNGFEAHSQATEYIAAHEFSAEAKAAAAVALEQHEKLAARKPVKMAKQFQQDQPDIYNFMMNIKGAPGGDDEVDDWVEPHEKAAYLALSAEEKAKVAEALAEYGPKATGHLEFWTKAHAAAEPAPAAGALVMPAFQEGKNTTGVVAYYEAQAQKVLDMAAADDAEGLANMKAEGLVPNSKGKISNTWAGKTTNSKTLIALHGQAIDHVGQKVGAIMEANPPAPVVEPTVAPVAPSLKEALKQAAADAAPAPAPVTSVPAPPKFNDFNFGLVTKEWHKLAAAGNWDALTASAEKLAESVKAKPSIANDPEFLPLLQYAQSLMKHAPSVAPSGPKEGDTKQGADGMLVLKDGHWQKVDEPTKAATASGLPAIPTFTSQGGKSDWAKNYQKVAQALHDAVEQHGAAGLKGVIVSHADGKFTIKAAGYHLKKVGPGDPQAYRQEMHAYITELKAAAGKPKKAPKAKVAPAPAPAPHQPGVEPMDTWKQVGPQGGSNPGGKFVDDQGVEWYCKFPGNEDVAKSEVLAAKLYAAAGIAGQDAKLVTQGGKLGIASKWQTVSKLDPKALSKADGVAAGFGVDAWLGNWDVVGLGYDNLQVGPDGKAVRVDAGGSLEYRAMGGKKAFGEHVIEIDSLRDAKINPQAAAVFGKMSNADLTASVSKVLGVSDAKIHALVHAFGPGDAAAKQKMISTLIARKADLAAKFPKAKKEKKIKPFKPEKISEPPSFMNWGGSGKSGPSSKEFLNAANEAAVQAIYAAAQTGSLDAVQGLAANIYNKESGQVTGSAPVLEHPSQHVKGYAQQAINEINYQLHPPKRFRFEGGHPLNSLHSAYPSHKGPLHGDIAKVGKFILLGDPGTVSLESLALPKHTYQSGAITTATFSTAAKQALAAMPETQKQAIKAYTGSSYLSMNNSLWSGNPSGAAKAAGEALHALGHDITPGTVLSRKLSVSGTGLDAILKSQGKILQEPAIMSTSIRPSSWGGNVQLKMHVGPGVKGLWVGKGSVGNSGALSNHPGEDELILPPNTRLLILSVKQSAGPDADGFGGSGVNHVIEAVILPTQASA